MWWQKLVDEAQKITALISNGALTVTGSIGLPSGAATASKQDDEIARLSSILAKIIAAPATEATLAAILPLLKQLAGFETLTAIDYSGGDQTSITDGSNGIWINTAGDLKIDTWGGATGVTFTVVVGLFPQRRVKKIYQTGSTAAGFIGYPPA